MPGNKNWIPLESNPDVLNEFLYSVGVPKSFSLYDVYNLEDKHLEEIPQPVIAVLLLLPITENYEHYISTLSDDKKENPANLFFMKQDVGNSCGSAALVNAVANCIDLPSDSKLGKFISQHKSSSPHERGDALGKDECLKEVHHAAAQIGQTPPPPAEESPQRHYVVLIHHEGSLYELDGHKDFIIKHGSTSREDLLKDAAKVCQGHMDRDKDNVNFNVMVLAAKPK